MARRSQCSSAGDNPLDPNYLPPHYREEYRLAIDALIDADLEGYYECLSTFNVVNFLSQTEIEYIKHTVQEPRQTTKQDRRYVTGDADGSSDTYWPTHSELDAPELDLGWPQQHRFIGPTEITTIVNPPDPEMPSIKEQARRMIKNAQQVIAIVMDTFTDVDIFNDILNAAMRNVAVYVLLDERNAHHFVAMANNCGINLDDIKFMRIRTVSGSTYFCHTGKSFKGQMMNRFMLVDCRIVLSGHYSFMWSFEKIHRCIAHVFLGHLVTTFDEEFRILYAQSEPLTESNPLTYVDDYCSVPGSQHSTGNAHMYIKQYPAFADNHKEWFGRSFEDHMDVGFNKFPYSRDIASHSSTEELQAFPGCVAKQIRGEHPFLDHRKFRKFPNTKETGGLHRYGYTEVPSYLYGSPQKNAANRGGQQMEGIEMQTSHFPGEEYFHPEATPEYDMYAKSRDQSYAQYDQYSESGSRAEIDDGEALSDYDHVQRYLQSYPAIETQPVGNMFQQGVQRHSVAPNYDSQASATKPGLKDRMCSFHIPNHQEEQKEGLRDWRISSYLSAFQNTAQLDMADFQRNEPNFPYAIPGTPSEPDISKTKHDTIGFTKLKPLPNKQMSLTLPENTTDPKQDSVTKLTRTTSLSASESSCTTEGDSREPKEPHLTHEEFFRRKPSIVLQRNSRLRHSLIFNSKLEQHSPEDKINVESQTDEDNSSKHDHVIYNILEKKKRTRETFKWTPLLKSSCDKSSDSTLPEELPSKTVETSVTSKDVNAQMIQEVAQQESSLISQNSQTQDRLAENSQITQHTPLFMEKAVPFIDMNDPECRLRFFKELAAKRKAELAVKNLSEASEKEMDSALGPVKKTNDESDSLPAASQKLLVNTVEHFQDPNSKDLVLHHKYKVASDSRKTMESDPQGVTSCSGIPVTATDAEKIKLKRKLTEDSGSSSDTAQQESATNANKGMELKTQNKLTRQQITTQNNSSSPFMSKKTTLPKVTGLKSSTSLNPDHLKLESVNSRAIADVNTFRKLSTQESHSNLNDLLRENATSTNASLSQDPAATEHKTVPSLPNTATGKVPSIETTIAATGCSKQSTPAETGHVEYTGCFGDTTTTQIPSCQNFPAADNPSKYSAPTETELSLHNIVMDIQQNKNLTATNIITNQHGISTDTEDLQHVTATKKCPSQHLTVTNSTCSQHFCETEIGSFHNPTATETDSIRDPSAEDTNTSQQPIEIGVTALQHPLKHCIATNNKTSQELSETEIDSLHQPNKTETVLSELTSVPENNFCQHSSATEFGPFTVPCTADVGTSQHPSETETCPSEFPIGTKSTCSEEFTVTKADTFQHSGSEEFACSQETTKTETVLLHHHTQAEIDSSTLPTVSQNDYLQHSPITEIGLVVDKTPSRVDTATPQHPNETDVGTLQHLANTRPSDYPTAKKSLNETEIDGSEQLNSIGTEHTAAELLTVPESDPFQHPSATQGASESLSAEETDTPQYPTETETFPSQHSLATKPPCSDQLTETVIDISQHVDSSESALFHLHTVTQTGSVKPSNVIENASVQQLPAIDTSSSEHISIAETDTPQHPTETDIGTLQHLTKTEKCPPNHHNARATVSLQNSSGSETGLSDPISAGEVISQHSIKPDLVTLQHPNATEILTQPAIATYSGSSQTSLSHHLSLSETDSSQHLNVTEPGSSLLCTLPETRSLRHSTADETGPFRHISAADKDNPQHSTEPDMETLEHPFTTETCSPFQQLTETETVSSKHSAVKETDIFQHSSATETGPSTDICTTEKSTSQHFTKTQIGSLQNPTATGACASQHSMETKSACSQHATENNTERFPQDTEIETSSLLHVSATDNGSVKKTFSTETDSPQYPTAKEKCTSQHSIATKSTCPENHAEIKNSTSQHSAAKEMDCFHQLTEAERDFSKDNSAADTDFSKLSILTQTDSFHHSSKHSSATESNTHTHLVATENCPPQHVITTVSDCLQHLTETEGGPSQNSSQMNPPSNTHVVESDLCQHAKDFCSESCLTMNCSSANLSLSVTPIDITHKEMDSTTTPLLECNILISDDFSVTNSCNTELTNTSPTPNADINNILIQTTHAPSTTLSQNNSQPDITPNETDLMNCSDQKDKSQKEPEGPKQRNSFITPVDNMLIESESCQNTTETEAHTSQGVEVLGSSSNEYSKSDIHANSSISENQSPTSSNQTELPLACSHLSQMQSHSGATLQQVNDGTLSLAIDSLDHSSESSEVCQPGNQVAIEIKSSSYSSNPEKDVSEIQNRELKNEEIQKQEKSVGLEIHETEKVNVDLDDKRVNKVKEMTKNIENSSYSHAEQTPNTCPTSCSVLETLTGENTIPTNHRSSTANVLSCSNLRDDTKVLLEQISAKNQGKPSKLTVDDTNANIMADKQNAGRVQTTTQSWSAKASQEEREKLLQGIENKRKEKKVYSRFEVP